MSSCNIKRKDVELHILKDIFEKSDKWGFKNKLKTVPNRDKISQGDNYSGHTLEVKSRYKQNPYTVKKHMDNLAKEINKAYQLDLNNPVAHVTQTTDGALLTIKANSRLIEAYQKKGFADEKIIPDEIFEVDEVNSRILKLASLEQESNFLKEELQYKGEILEELYAKIDETNSKGELENLNFEIENLKVDIQNVRTSYENALSNISDLEIELRPYKENSEEDLAFAPLEQKYSNNLNTVKRPISDYFDDVQEFYKDQLKTLNQKIKSIDRQIGKGFSNDKDLINQRTKLDLVRLKYEETINQMKNSNSFYILKVLFDEIESINQALDNATPEENLSERVDFVNLMVQGVSHLRKNLVSDLESLQDFIGFDELSSQVNKMNKKYAEEMPKIGRTIAESDILFQNYFADLTDQEIDDLFSVGDDIGVMEKLTLGVGQSTNKDGILPQIAKSLLDNAKIEHDSIPKDKKDRLIKAAETLKSKDYSWIFELSEYGNRTGNLINFYSSEFAEAIKYYYKIYNSSKKNKTSNQAVAEQLQWLKANIEIVDITKLKWVKDLYENEFGAYFTSSDIEMDEYENELKRLLGPLYEIEKEKIKKRLELFNFNRQSLIANNDPDADRKILLQNPFEFVRNFNSEEPETTLYGMDSQGSMFSVLVDPNINNFSFLPKEKVIDRIDMFGNVTYKDTNYYNKDFYKMAEDPNKFEYWKAITDLYQNYINPVYNKDLYSGISYGKVEEDLFETVATAKGLDKVVSGYQKAATIVRSGFYHPMSTKKDGEIHRNYTDVVEGKRRILRDSLNLKSVDELYTMSEKLGLNIPKDAPKRVFVREISTFEALKGTSTDLNRVTITLTDLASYHAARQDVLPKIEALLEYHKTLVSDNNLGKERKASIERFQNFIDVVVKNQPNLDGNEKIIDKKAIASLNSKSKVKQVAEKVGKYYSKTDKKAKKIFEEAQKTGHTAGETNFVYKGKYYKSVKSKKDNKIVYFETDIETDESRILNNMEFETVFQEYLLNKLDNLGVVATTASVINAVQKGLIFQGMYLNPYSGVTNRLEGKDTNWRMDATGVYWTPGNMEVAENFLALANVTGLAHKATGLQTNRINQLNIFRRLLKNMDIIQDRKAEIDKNIALSNNNYSEWLNGYAMAIDNPEFKNQGGIVLSILMDVKVKDDNGVEHPIFDKEKNEFTIFNLVDGQLELKEGFRKYNEITWGKFSINKKDPKNNSYALARAKMKSAIARSQGNYDNTDTIMALNSVIGRLLMQYKRWMPEHYMQRFNTNDKDFDLSTGKRKSKGRYIAVTDNLGALAGAIGVSLGITVGMTSTIGFLGIGTVALASGIYLKRAYNRKNVLNQANQVMVLAEFLKSVLGNTINYPLRLAHLPAKFRLPAKVNSDSTGLTMEEANLITAATRDLAGMLNMLWITALAYGLLWDEDDPEAKQRANFVDNQLTKLLTSQAMWINPQLLMEDAFRTSLFNQINKVYNSAKEIAKDDTDWSKASGALPMPTIIKNLLDTGSLVQNKRDFTPGLWQDNWGKNIATNGEYGLKKDIKSTRKKLKESLLEEYSDMLEDRYPNLEEEEIQNIAERETQNTMKVYMPKKRSGMTHKEYSKTINLEKLKDIDVEELVTDINRISVTEEDDSNSTKRRKSSRGSSRKSKEYRTPLTDEYDSEED